MTSNFLMKSISRAALAAITLLPAPMPALAQAPIPVNFRPLGPATAAGGVLTFKYAWDSSAGGLPDLAGCLVLKKEKYPGDATPYVLPKPPWDQKWPNPTISAVPAIDGKLQDDQGPGKFAPLPYKAAEFQATETFSYHCDRNAKPVDGALMGPIDIDRKVAARGGGCFFYTITKSGEKASINPLLDPACTFSPAGAVAQVLSASASSSESQTEGAAVSFVPTESGFGLHEPIYIELSVQNNLTESIRFDLGLNRKANLEFAITEPEDSKTVTSRLSDRGFGRVGQIVLGPNQTFAARLLLNEWYDFANPGTYRVTPKLSGSVTTESGTSVKTTVSANFSVEVKAQDPQRLALISQQLADVAINAPDMADAMDAALALSYIDDPVAVPSLRRLLVGETMVEGFATNGLARIANGEAVDALIAASIGGNDEVRSLARSALKRAEGQVKDPDLKNRIANALRAQQ